MMDFTYINLGMVYIYIYRCKFGSDYPNFNKIIPNVVTLK